VRLVRYTPLILWTGVVLFLSTSNASLARTSRIIRPLLEFLFPGAPEQTLLFYHGLIRKFAHFAEYAVLVALAYSAFSAASVRFLSSRAYIAGFGFACLVALIDETNQAFMSERTGSAVDVLLDVSGALTALVVLRVILSLRKN
jgi:VanZ family protein